MSDILEFKSSDIIKSKEKNRVFLEGLRSGFKVALVFLAIRLIVMFILSLDDANNFSELLSNRYYYGEGKFKMYNFLQTNIFYPVDHCLDGINDKLILYTLVILMIIPALIIYVLTLIGVPVMICLLKVICMTDSIAPESINVIVFWFLFFMVLGTIRCLFTNNIAVAVESILTLCIIVSFFANVYEVTNNPSNVNIKTIVNTVQESN